MRKRKTIFFDCLLAVIFCYTISSYFNQSDKDSVMLLTGCLLLVCTLIIFPVALYNLRTASPLLGGLRFLFMTSPLLAVLSHPAISLAKFHLLLAKAEFLAAYNPYLLNAMLNILILFLSGYLFVRINNGLLSTWKCTALTTIALIGFYTLSVYYLSIQPSGIFHITG